MDAPASMPVLATTSSRGLACSSCQQRKVKCDRTCPCNNCTRRGEKCVPGTAILPKQRRRRFAERELLDRLRHYEDLLKENNIPFAPLHKDQPERKLKHFQSDGVLRLMEKDDPDDGIESKPVFVAKDYWRTLNDKKSPGLDDDSEDDVSSDAGPSQGQIQDIWADIHEKNGHRVPFGLPVVPIDLSSQHPDQITIFKLWQIYLDNVNPLLKVTHTPTLQPRIIVAGSNVAAIQPSLNALMFSIYCMSILTLTDNECDVLFGASRDATLTIYQTCTQQALTNCGILCTSDREALTALYLYLLSVAPSIDPQSCSSLLGIAMRIAQRMRLHNESTYDKLPVLEAELCRRLWWSLVLLDTRIGELAGNVSSLRPTWDCHIPLNANDFELQNHLESSLKASKVLSEAIFPLVRSEMADMIRNTSCYLDFVNPALKLIGKRNQKINAPLGGEITAIAKELEDKYLVHCNTESSIQYMTLWSTRAFIAKSQLLEQYSVVASDPSSQTDEHRDAATSFALTMLECDTKLMTHPLVQGFKWYLYLYLPMPAYFQILLDLKRRPSSRLADRAWQVMGDHFESRTSLIRIADHYRIFLLFAKLTARAWQAREALAAREGRSLAMPSLIMQMNVKAEELRQSQMAPHVADEVAKLNFDNSGNLLKMVMPESEPIFGDGSFDAMGVDMRFDMNPQSLLGVNLETFDWDNMDWNPLQNRGW